MAMLFAAAPGALAEAPPMTIELNIFAQPQVYRYGKKVDYFFLTGWGMADAFKEVPEAHHLAKRYEMFTTWGNAASFVGTAAMLGGVIYRLDHEYKFKEHPPSLALWLGGTVLSLGGGFVAASAPRLIYQAVNVFNERVQPEMLPEFDMQMTQTGAPEYRMTWSYRP